MTAVPDASPEWCIRMLCLGSTMSIERLAAAFKMGVDELRALLEAETPS